MGSVRSPRWRKALADIRLSRSRTILVVLSIMIGVFAVGALLTTREVLHRGSDAALNAANSASAVLMTQPFDEQLVTRVRALEDIGYAEGRALIPARLQIADGTWLNLDIHAISDFNATQVDRIVPETGASAPEIGEVLLERQSLQIANLSISDQLTIGMPDGTQHALALVGSVYDPGQVDPSLSGDRLNAYITIETLATLGQPTMFNSLHIITAENPRQIQQGERVAALVRDQVFTPSDVVVHRIAVQDTPRYHSAALSDALILILGILGLLILLLAAFLVINTVNAILAQQVRQIGVMKAIGGQRRQIASVYFALVLVYGLLAVLIAIPLGILVAWFMAGYIANLLNIDAAGPWLPLSVVAVELMLGLLIPLLAVLVPVLRGTSITVREAITSYGLSGEQPAGQLLSGLRRLSRPVRLSLRNTFRRRGRLALTLATLTLGGAIFASVTTVQSSLNGTFDEMMGYWNYDVQVDLDEASPIETALQVVRDQPGVVAAEGWIATNASYLRDDGSQNSNVWVTAPPADSTLIQPTMIEGRWLESGDSAALVINIDFKNDEDLAIGDVVTLSVEGHELRWPVVGISTSQLTGPVVYVAHERFSDAVGLNGMANRIVLATDRHDAAAQNEAGQQAEEGLRAAGVPVTQIDSVSELRGGARSIFDLLVVLLIVVGFLLMLVGSLGLTGAMSLNVIERTREIGVMRAIGASNGTLAQIVIVEGLVIGLIGWALGAILAVPLSWVLAYVIGVGFVQTPLVYVFSFLGIGLWLVVVVLLSALASLLPARRAWRLSIREALAYE